METFQREYTQEFMVRREYVCCYEVFVVWDNNLVSANLSLKSYQRYVTKKWSRGDAQNLKTGGLKSQMEALLAQDTDFDLTVYLDEICLKRPPYGKPNRLSDCFRPCTPAICKLDIIRTKKKGFYGHKQDTKIQRIHVSKHKQLQTQSLVAVFHRVI